MNNNCQYTDEEIKKLQAELADVKDKKSDNETYYQAVIAELRGQNEQLTERVAVLEKALLFYADADNYHSIAFLFDPPCGEFKDDFDQDYDSYDDYERPMPGKRARKALEDSV